MKARHEFKTDESYYEYLRHYYAGQAMQGYMIGINYEKIDTKEKIAICSRLQADALINQLKFTNEK